MHRLQVLIISTLIVIACSPQFLGAYEYSRDKAFQKQDSVKLSYKIYLGLNFPFTEYAYEPYFQLGGSFIYKRNEFKTQFLFGTTPSYERELKSGVSLEYFYHDKMLHDRIKLGAITAIGYGQFYYSWGENRSIMDRLYVRRGVIFGPALSITVLKYKKTSVDLVYNSGVLYAHSLINFNSLSINLNQKLK